MTLDHAKTCSSLALFRAVFGKQDNQTLSEFVKEVEPLKNDAKFIQECRDYAIANLIVTAP